MKCRLFHLIPELCWYSHRLPQLISNFDSACMLRMEILGINMFSSKFFPHLQSLVGISWIQRVAFLVASSISNAVLRGVYVGSDNHNLVEQLSPGNGNGYRAKCPILYTVFCKRLRRVSRCLWWRSEKVTCPGPLCTCCSWRVAFSGGVLRPCSLRENVEFLFEKWIPDQCPTPPWGIR